MYTNSSLVEYTKLSPNCNARTSKIKKITIHHAACVASAEAIGSIFASSSRQASSNYGVGNDGKIAMYVEEKNRAWTSSNFENDNQAVTIEVSNSAGAPNWPVSDKAMEATIKLCVDICKRNGIEKLNFTGNKNGNLTMHCYFASTACPGPYLKGKFAWIAEEVNRRLGVSNDIQAPVVSDLYLGDTIKLVPDAKYINGKNVPSWLYNMTLYVRGINGDDITFSTLKTGAITGIVSRKYIVDDKKPVQNNTPTTPVTNAATSSFKLGDEVKLAAGATYYNGQSIPSWVFNQVLYVRAINGEDITISTLKSGAITGIVKAKSLTLRNATSSSTTVKEEPAKTSDFIVGEKVKLTSGAKYTTGQSIPLWVTLRTLYVREISGDNVVISTLQTGAITGVVNKKYLKKV